MKRLTGMKRYNTNVIFTQDLIAPCGMNCGACLSYMRLKNHCPGCRSHDESKPVYCRSCIIINCTLLHKTTQKFCFECYNFPCKRLKQLNKRYSTKYFTSFFSNQNIIRDKGIEALLHIETQRRTCPECGSTLSIHRSHCLECGYKVTEEHIS